jgi:urease accessory protein
MLGISLKLVRPSLIAGSPMINAQSIALLNRLRPYAGLCSAITIALASIAPPTLAHHPMGGKVSATVFEGFMSGIAHPVIGVDHLTFIIAIGLLAATQKRGIWFPIAFVITAMMGTGLHLQGVFLPGSELFVAGSILVVGLLLTQEISLNTIAILGLSALAGLCHGYAYGEAIIGAETTPLVAYLIGFSLIQLLISITAFWLAKTMTIGSPNLAPIPMRQLRSAGLILCGAGTAFLLPQLVGIILPVPRS